MKKLTICLAVIAMIGMTMTSCQKEGSLSKITFTASTETPGGKTHLENLNIKWDNEGESILVSDGTIYTIYDAINVSNNNTCAEFACEEGQDITASTYKIYYPASSYVSDGRIAIPSHQQYNAEKGIEGFPMYAETADHTLHFNNLCGVLHLNLQKTGVTVRGIRVYTDKKINGQFDIVRGNDGKYRIATDQTNVLAEKYINLDCGAEGVNIDTPKDFYLYLPTGDYTSPFEIAVVTTDGYEMLIQLGRGVVFNIGRSTIHTITRDDNSNGFIPQPRVGTTGSMFSVSATKQVLFSIGNLCYSASNNSWNFKLHQYDYDTTFDGTEWDHFGWSTTMSNFGISTSMDNNDYRGDFVDWGVNLAYAYGIEHWYTMSTDEWQYLINGRPNAANLVGCATVCGIHGLIILPDDWSDATTHLSMGDWSSTVLDASAWRNMELNGAVFLPAAGQREGDAANGFRNAGSKGYYWTRNTNNNNSAGAYFMQNTETSISTTGFAGRYNGQSVRLVCDVF